MRRLHLSSIVALCCAVPACSVDVPNGTNSDGTGASCATRACGGDIFGTWSIQSSCVTGAGLVASMDLREPACEGAFRDVRARTSGSVTFSPSGTFTRSQSIVIDMEMVFTPGCIDALSGGIGAADVCPALQQQFSSSVEFAAAACGVQAGACLCSLSTHEQRLDGSGTFRVEGVELVEQIRHPFCVEGNRLQYWTTVNDVTSMLTLTRVQ